MSTTCKTPSCGAQLDWATRHDNPSKHVPLDHDRSGDADGQMAAWKDRATGKLLYRPLKDGDQLRPGEERRVSHYATCPEPGQHSRKQAKR